MQATARRNSKRRKSIPVRGECGRRVVSYLTEEQWSALAKRAEEESRPVGELIRASLVRDGLIPGNAVVMRGTLSHRG